ncbi:hypothetical protein [Microcoleus sp. A2-C2]|uniref:hypothetical protein n=1 Tax=Microcoleus sp. A2-C2 TaxID=2818530 RepID=UPI002FD527CC
MKITRCFYYIAGIGAGEGRSGFSFFLLSPLTWEPNIAIVLGDRPHSRKIG